MSSGCLVNGAKTGFKDVINLTLLYEMIILNMKNSFLSLFFLSLFSTSIFANEYNCSYFFDDEEFNLTLTKNSEYSYLFNMDYESEEYILGESDKLLIVGNPMLVDDETSVFRTIILDKVEKMITITSIIEPNQSELYPGGVWGYAKGYCD